jgi:hypothetical protein
VKPSTRNRLTQFLFCFAVLVCCGAMLSGATTGTAWARAQAADKSEAAKNQPPQFSASAMLIERGERSDETVLPEEFRVAAYENTFEKISDTKIFKQVFRSGDSRAKSVSDLVTLRFKPKEFQKGSEAERGATTIKGWTKLIVTATITDASGKVLVEQDLTGKVRFIGGNLDATNDLAKQAAKLIKENFKPAA